jgi:2C-methyl-D-erythritol 2,4-cyclodiphosphate synthase
MQEGESGVLYHSALFSVNASSPGDAALLQTGDAIGAVVGQIALTAASNKLEKVWKVAAGKQMISRLENAIDARKAKLKSLNLANLIDTDATIKGMEAEITSVKDAKAEFKKMKADAIAAKEKLKLPLTGDEKALKAAAAADDVAKGGAVAADGIKAQKSLGVMAKFKGGIAKAKNALKGLQDMFKRIFTKSLTKFSEKFAIQHGVIWGVLSAMNAAMTAAAVATLGVLAPLEVIIAIMTAAYGIVDAVCTVLTILLMILLPTLLDKALANGGVCASGKPIDQIISDDFLYFLFTTFS